MPILLREYPRPRPADQTQPRPPAMMSPGSEKRPALMLMELQTARMVRAVMSERQLQEVMVDFWMNHFNVFGRRTVSSLLIDNSTVDFPGRLPGVRQIARVTRLSNVELRAGFRT